VRGLSPAFGGLDVNDDAARNRDDASNERTREVEWRRR
jgi:hypothetical protein